MPMDALGQFHDVRELRAIYGERHRAEETKQIKVNLPLRDIERIRSIGLLRGLKQAEVISLAISTLIGKGSAEPEPASS